MKNPFISPSSRAFTCMIAASIAVALTTAVEAAAPTVVTLSPENGATLVPGDSNLVATFSEPIQAVAPIVTMLLDEDFEADDGGFTVAIDGATGSQWAHGAPDSVGEFGGSVTSGNDTSLRCWGINLGDFTNDPAERGYFVASTVTSLRSPVIDLTSATSAELVFAQALDIEANDSAVINIINATTDDIIAAAVHTSLDIDINTAEWEIIGPIDLSAGLGQEIRIEWAFTGSGGASNDYIGWYIDDVQVTEVIEPEGFVTLKNLTAATESTIPINDPQISVTGDTLTIDPASELSPGDVYAIQISADAITNLTDEAFAGILDDDTWSFTVAVGPTIITPVSATSTTQHDADRAIGKTIDGSGLFNDSDKTAFTDTLTSTNITSVVAGAATTFFGTNTYWLSGSTAMGGSTVSATETLTFNLGDAYDLKNIYLWNYNRDAPTNNRALKTFHIAFSTDNGATYSTPVSAASLGIGDFTLHPPTAGFGAAAYVPVDIREFTSTHSGVTHVQLTNLETYGSTGFIGFLEIRFGALVDEVAPGDTYADWIAGFPGVGGQTGFNDDPDGDGIPNGMENFFGTAPDEFSTGLVAVEVAGGAFTFTHPQNATPASDVVGAYLWSKDLATWHGDGASDGDGTTVSFDAETDTPSAGTTTVTATVAGTPTDKLFVTIEVTQAP